MSFHLRLNVPLHKNYGELTSVDEQRKFQRLGPIDLREVRACDLDQLCKKLLDAP